MPPRRCLPSWLGRQLHANGGGGLTGVGLMVALQVFWQGPCRGPGKGLAVAPAVIPGKDLAGGLVVLLGWDPAKDHHLLKGVSDLECLHKDLDATTGMSPNPCPMGAVDSRVIRSIGVGRAATARVLLGLLKPPPSKDLAGGSPLRLLCSLWSWPWRHSASPELRPYLGSPPLPCSVWWCPWLRLPCTVIGVQKVYPSFCTPTQVGKTHHRMHHV